MTDRVRRLFLLGSAASLLLASPHVGVAADADSKGAQTGESMSTEGHSTAATGTAANRAIEPPAPTGSSAGRIALAAADVFPIRFGSFLRLVVGGAMLVPAELFTAMSWPLHRNDDLFVENYELYVGEPVEYTFKRPLGEEL